MELHIKLEQKINWLDDKGFVTRFTELPFTFYTDRDRKSHTEMINVPLFKDFNVCDEYRDYVRKIEYKFHEEFKKHLLSL